LTIGGQVVQNNVSINLTLLEFKGGKIPLSNTTIPYYSQIHLLGIIPSQIDLEDVLGAVFIGFVILGLIISVCFSIYFFVNRNKKSSPLYYWASTFAWPRNCSGMFHRADLLALKRCGSLPLDLAL